MEVLKKICAGALCVSVMAGMAGCGKSTKVVKDGEPVELSMFMHFMNYCVYDENWPIFKKAAELTGVTLHGTASATISESAQAWNTMLVSDKLPDIIHGSRAGLTKLAEDGGLVPLEDLIEKNAPNVAKFFEECPEAKRIATANDGHIYYIPGSLSGLNDGVLPSKGWFIRTDWLDKLGLEAPKNVDELYNVLTAFKTQDPNGNGKNDEIPYFARELGVSDLYQLFDAKYEMAPDGDQYVFGPITEEYKNAMINISKWYKEGLIDKEIFSRGQNAREQLLSSNTGGMTHDWFSTTASYNDTYKDTVSDFAFKTITPPADVNGVVKEKFGRSILHNYAWGISKDNSNPELTMKYFDFWMSDEGKKLNAFGVEGIHHNIVDGAPVFTDEVLNSSEGVPSYMRNQGQVEIGTVGSIQAEIMGMNEIAREGFTEYREKNYVMEQTPVLTFTAEEQEVRNKYQNDINTFTSEYRQKWVMGKADIESTWDSYVSELKKMGVDELVAVYNSAYARYKSN